MSLENDLRQKAEDEFNLSYLDEAQLWLAWRVVRKKVVPKVKTWILGFWNDPAQFKSGLRSAYFLLCQLIVAGIITFPVGSKAAWFAALITGPFSLAVNAGQKNRTPEEIKAIAHDPNVQG